MRKATTTSGSSGEKSDEMWQLKSNAKWVKANDQKMKEMRFSDILLNIKLIIRRVGFGSQYGMALAGQRRLLPCSME